MDRVKQRNKIIKEYEELSKQFSKKIVLEGEEKHLMGFDKENAERKQKTKIRSQLFNKLIEYEDFLREVMKELGFLGVRKEDLTKMKY